MVYCGLGGDVTITCTIECPILTCVVTLILMCYSESALPKLYRDSPYEYLLDPGNLILLLLHLNALSRMVYAMKCVVNISFLHCVFKKLFPDNISIIQSSIHVRHTNLL